MSLVVDVVVARNNNAERKLLVLANIVLNLEVISLLVG
jgi:hypothetical protein